MKAKPTKMGRPPRTGNAAADSSLKVRMSSSEKRTVMRLAKQLTNGDMSAVVRKGIQLLADEQTNNEPN